MCRCEWAADAIGVWTGAADDAQTESDCEQCQQIPGASAAATAMRLHALPPAMRAAASHSTGISPTDREPAETLCSRPLWNARGAAGRGVCASVVWPFSWSARVVHLHAAMTGFAVRLCPPAAIGQRSRETFVVGVSRSVRSAVAPSAELKSSIGS